MLFFSAKLFICIITKGTACSIFLNRLFFVVVFCRGVYSPLPSAVNESKLKSKLKDEVVSK